MRVRRTVAAGSLAVAAAVAGTPLLAGRDNNKATYTCGTALGTVKQAEGRLNTLNLATIGFVPDSRTTKPLLIRYRSVTRLEYGRTPPHRIETPETSPVTLRCTSRWQDNHLTIFYKEVPPVVEDEKKDPSEPKDQREKDKQAREERRKRLDPKDPQDQTDAKERKKEEKAREDRLKEKEHFAVFEIGDGVLRPTLRILETRTGKRIHYQDADSRKAAR
jgi:hypothetical protein